MFFVSGQRVIIIFSEKTKLLIAKNVILCLIGKPRRPRGLFPLHLQSISNEDSKRQLFHEKKKTHKFIKEGKDYQICVRWAQAEQLGDRYVKVRLLESSFGMYYGCETKGEDLAVIIRRNLEIKDFSGTWHWYEWLHWSGRLSVPGFFYL